MRQVEIVKNVERKEHLNALESPWTLLEALRHPWMPLDALMCFNLPLDALTCPKWKVHFYSVVSLLLKTLTSTVQM